ncbi:MAG: lipopolysaccharide biosynthesis protein [Candidatus Entotheonellia bacterium]
MREAVSTGQVSPGRDAGLAVQAVRGVLWSGAGQIGIQALGFLVSVVLARLLSPREYGLATATSLVTGFLASLGGTGLIAALVQRVNVTDEDLDTSFWAGLGLGGGMALLLVAAAHQAAVFFREPLIAPLLMVQAVGLVLTPLGTVHTALLMRKMDFRSLAMVDLSTVAGSGVLAIGMALSGWGVWSLVVPGLVGTGLGIVVLWQHMTWRARGGMALGALRALARFSLSVCTFNVLNYVRGNVDYLVLGRVLGTGPLGLYYLAYNLTTLPQTRLVPVITRVLFPALSAVQDDLPRLGMGYARAVRYVSLVTFPLLIGLAILAPEFVLAVFGVRWVEAAPLVRILSIAGLLYSVGTTTGSVLFSRGRADLACWIGIAGAVAMTGCVLVGARYGALGVAVGVATYATISFLPIQLLANRLINLRPGEFLRALVPATFGSLVMAVVLIGAKVGWGAVGGATPLAALLVLVPLATASYVGALRVAYSDVLAQLAGVVRQAFGARPVGSRVG